MAFGDIEASRDRGSPVDLYLFRFGSGENDVYGFTDHDEAIEVELPAPDGLVTFAPIAIDRNEIQASGKLEDATLRVTTQADTALTALFQDYPPSQTVSLVLRQGHIDDPAQQYIVAWTGRVLGFQLNEDAQEAELSCEPLSSSMRRVMIRRHWQYGCPHVLYGPQCRAERASFTVEAVALAVNQSTVSLSPTWETTERKPRYEGGLAAWTLADGRTVERSIIKTYTNGQVTFAGPATGLEPGEVVALSMGCKRTMDDCNLFQNILNFGGMPWIPTQNPVGIKNNFY